MPNRDEKARLCEEDRPKILFHHLQAFIAYVYMSSARSIASAVLGRFASDYIVAGTIPNESESGAIQGGVTETDCRRHQSSGSEMLGRSLFDQG